MLAVIHLCLLLIALFGGMVSMVKVASQYTNSKDVPLTFSYGGFVIYFAALTLEVLLVAVLR